MNAPSAPLGLTQAPFVFGGPELFLVLLTSAIIFGILGPRLWREITRGR